MAILAFQKPDKVIMVEADEFKGTFEFRPLEPGFGITIGNALRRILLSSLEGYAITSMKIDGVDHEFSSITGVIEDVTDIVLNLKQVRFKKQVEDETTEKVNIVIGDQDVFKAGDINKFLNNFQVLNPDLEICHMEPSVKLNVELTINKGRGYVPADENGNPNAPIGTIAIDSIHTPIKNVQYRIENYRVEQKTDYEKLLMEIDTDGSVHPKDALKEASKIIKEQYSKIQSQYQNLQALNSKLLSAQSELMNANIETEKEKEYFAATLSSVGDGVITYDMSGRVFLINSVAEQLTGVTQEMAAGKKIREVVRLNDKASNDILFSALGKLDEKNRYNNIGIPFTMTDIHGAERIIELNSSLIRLKGNPIGIIMILRDITVKYKIDNEINKMSKLESIGLLAGGIAHDFNNLLTGISGNISIAKNTDNLSVEMSEIINDIEKATERASALTKQLLTFARGGAPLITPSSIEELLSESVKLLIKDPLVHYSLIIAEDISPVLIDPNQISQAINNLLINSMQAMPDGGKIVIEAKNAESIPAELNPDKNYVYIRISDNGPGIDEKNLKKIFDPFYTTKTAGTGLGLTSTYSIIKKHKGHIQVISPQGEGASFEIYLPASKETPGKLQQINRKNSRNIGEGSILIMDDEQYILEVFVKMLKHLGFTVDCAKNGEEAIKLYKEKFNSGFRYSYVILDLTIPGGMGGKAAITEMRKIDPDINAIVSSGYSENPVMANYQTHGFKGILKKPYTLEDIIDLFERLGKD